VTGLNWILTAWAVVGGGVVIWFHEALVLLEGPQERRDRSTCACCRHDAVAHEHAGPGDGCTQCPCEAFRRSR
jgi:hypothetical protein